MKTAFIPCVTKMDVIMLLSPQCCRVTCPLGCTWTSGGGVATALGLLASLQGMGYMPPPRPQEVGIGVNLEEFIVMQAPSSCYYLKSCQLPLLSTKACTYNLWLLELLDRKIFSFSPNYPKRHCIILFEMNTEN